MNRHIDHIRALMAITGEGFLFPLAVLFTILGVSWIAAIMAWGIA